MPASTVLCFSHTFIFQFFFSLSFSLSLAATSLLACDFCFTHCFWSFIVHSDCSLTGDRNRPKSAGADCCSRDARSWKRDCYLDGELFTVEPLFFATVRSKSFNFDLDKFASTRLSRVSSSNRDKLSFQINHRTDGRKETARLPIVYTYIYAR